MTDTAGHTGDAIDPTANVIALVIAESKRQDDLRAAAKELSDVKHTHESVIGKLREEYQEKIGKAESGRLDSIRQVDREEVAKTAVAANTALSVLAKQTTELATTLDKKMTDTAIAAEQRSSAVNSDFNKRIAALELSSSEGKGKQTVADPALERLAAVVEKLAAAQDRNSGKGEGLSQGWAIFGGAILLALAIYGGIFKGTAQASVAPQVIYVPAPAAGNSAPLPGTAAR